MSVCVCVREREGERERGPHRETLRHPRPELLNQLLGGPPLTLLPAPPPLRPSFPTWPAHAPCYLLQGVHFHFQYLVVSVWYLLVGVVLSVSSLVLSFDFQYLSVSVWCPPFDPPRLPLGPYLLPGTCSRVCPEYSVVSVR